MVLLLTLIASAIKKNVTAEKKKKGLPLNSLFKNTSFTLQRGKLRTYSIPLEKYPLNKAKIEAKITFF